MILVGVCSLSIETFFGKMASAAATF